MPKLIFVNRYFYPDHSATSQMLTDLAFELAKDESLEIHVVTSRQRYDDALAKLPAAEQIQSVHIHRVWTFTFGRQRLLGRAFDYLSFYVTAFFRLYALAGRGDTVIAKTDPPLISTVAALAAWLKSAVLVNWVQDLFPEVAAALGLKLAKGPVYSLLRWLRNHSLQAAKFNVAIGEQMRQRLIGEGLPQEQVRVIHNWADGEGIKPIPAEANPLRKEWGLENKFVVGYSGNFGRSHDFDTLMDAAERLKDIANIGFLLIGGGAKLEWVKQEAARRGLSNILFKPYQPRASLSQSLSAADAHLITLKPELEGLIVPSKVYGIMASGRPVLFIGATQGEIARIIEDAGCGISIQTGDADALVSSTVELFDNPARRSQMGDSARRAFAASYTQSAAVSQWKAVLGVA